MSVSNKLLLASVIFGLVGFGQLFSGEMSADASPSTSDRQSLKPEEYESQVLAIVQTIHVGELEQARALVEAHVSEYPNSRVGYLLKADILQAVTFQLKQVGEGASPRSKKILDLKHQIRNRWRHLVNKDETSNRLVPASLIKMGRHKHVMVADQQTGRLYLYRNHDELPVLEKDYYLTLGSAGSGKQVSGDLKTPIGVYSIYKHIAASALPDLYGSGAFPVDYPNRLDRYRKRTGYGIWLHGTPSDTYARSPWASEGCFVLSNTDLLDIQQYIDVEAHTPVILSDQINWISVEQLQLQRAPYLKMLADWKRDRTNQDPQAYLAYYAQEKLNFGNDDIESWAKRHEKEIQSEEFAQIELDIESLFLYPGEQDIFVVKYRHHSPHKDSFEEISTEQYWKRNVLGQWKILYEG